MFLKPTKTASPVIADSSGHFSATFIFTLTNDLRLGTIHTLTFRSIRLELVTYLLLQHRAYCFEHIQHKSSTKCIECKVYKEAIWYPYYFSPHHLMNREPFRKGFSYFILRWRKTARVPFWPAGSPVEDARYKDPHFLFRLDSYLYHINVKGQVAKKRKPPVGGSAWK